MSTTATAPDASKEYAKYTMVPRGMLRVETRAGAAHRDREEAPAAD